MDRKIKTDRKTKIDLVLEIIQGYRYAYVPKAIPSSMDSGRLSSSVSGSFNDSKPANTEAPPNMTRGTACPN